jgi:hypothetical protein
MIRDHLLCLYCLNLISFYKIFIMFKLKNTKFILILINLMLIILISILHFKQLTPANFIQVIKYKILGPQKIEFDIINYFCKNDFKDLNFIGHGGGAPDWLFTES